MSSFGYTGLAQLKCYDSPLPYDSISYCFKLSCFRLEHMKAGS